MSRHYDDWLAAFLDYAKYGEAPRRMLFWAGVSAISGALRRKVWIDQAYFKWVPNLYIIFVAPPGIVSKTTTVSTAMSLLRKVDGIKFGPDVVTWQALVTTFADATELFQLGEEWTPMSAVTLESGELGNLLDPRDTAMIDLLVSLWDGKQGSFRKETKTSGSDSIENPWINMIACTTPAWIAGNFPEYTIGGGFTSRCLFVYADEKDRLVAYPVRHIPPDLKEREEKLVADLAHIAATHVGEYKLTEEAYAWGEAWYVNHYKNRPPHLDDERFGGYIARKQTMIHKVAMILAAAQSDKMVITDENLRVACEMLSDLEPDMQKVFSRIGRTDTSNNAERLLGVIKRNPEGVPLASVYRAVYSLFPSQREFEDVLGGLIKSQTVGTRQNGSTMILYFKADMSQQAPK